MGINSFWETFFPSDEKEYHVVNLFELASNHIRDTSQPYRIAVDTPYWVFKNLSTKQAETIRLESHMAANPIEKAILYRLIKLACHGIQVVLVFDGNRKPEKRGKEGNRYTAKEHQPLLRETAEKLGVPCWQAPAEAEAECARMQELGIVNAVFSEDSDTFMFKGETVLRFHMESKKSYSHALMYRVSEIENNFPGTWKDMVLFAALVGGDYASKGLPGCGKGVAEDAAKQGYGVSLVDAYNNNRLNEWRQNFGKFLKSQNSKIIIPKDFPNVKALKGYIEPQVSDDHKLQSGITWGTEVNQGDLQCLVTSRFNYKVKKYIESVCCMLLVRKLLSGPEGADGLGLEIVKRVSWKESGNIEMSKVSYELSAVTDWNVLETWLKLAHSGSEESPYSLTRRVECGIPNSIIRLALPHLLEKQSTKTKRSTVASDIADLPKEPQKPGLKRKPGRPRKDTTDSSEKANAEERAQASGQKKKPGRPKKDRGPSIRAEHPAKKARTDHGKSAEFSIHQNHGVNEMPSIGSAKGTASCYGTALFHQDNSPRLGPSEGHTSQQHLGHFHEGLSGEGYLRDFGSNASKTAGKATKQAELADDDFLDEDLDDDLFIGLFEEIAPTCTHSSRPGIAAGVPKGQQSVLQRQPLSVLGENASNKTAAQRGGDDKDVVNTGKYLESRDRFD